MLINTVLLKKFVELPEDAVAIETLLMRAGAEVEAVFVRAEQLKDVVIGEILEKKPIKGRNGMFVSRVDIGGDEVIDVVHGDAYAVEPGMRVPVAPAGAELPELKVEARDVAGFRSQGMICPDIDLGIIAAGDGLQRFGDEVAAGTPLVEIARPADIIFDVSVTPNRGDMLSHFGIAREISAVTGLPLTEPNRIPDLDALPPGNVKITIEDPALCSVYIGTVVENVLVRPAPEWMRTTLASVGVRPINNLVDLTNYVLIEHGNPLHAFDLKLLKGGVRVAAAKEGDRITLLDSDREVSPVRGSPLIIDDSGPIALAGVMGGAKHSIMDNTTSLFLEAALFDPVAIRRSARSVNISTESSYRFERGVVKDSVVAAVRRTVYLLEEMLPDCRITGVNIAAEPLPEEPAIPVTAERAFRDIGVELNEDELAESLARCGWTDTGDNRWRPDRRRYYLDEPLDAFEDIAKVIDYAAVPYLAPERNANTVSRDVFHSLRRRLKRAMAAAGFHEVITPALVSKNAVGTVHRLPGLGDTPAVKVRNPISEEFSFVRDSLLPSLADRVRHNVSLGSRSVSLFEIAPVYVTDESSETGARFRWALSAAAHGLDNPGDWQGGERSATLHGFAGRLLSVLRGLLPGVEFRFETARLAGFAPAVGARLSAAGEVIGAIGKIDEKLAAAWKAPAGIFLLEIDLGPLVEHVKFIPNAKMPSKHPPLLRDLSITAPDGTIYAEIEKTIRSRAGEYLEALRLYDLYTGKQVENGRFSLTFSLVFRAPDRALTDEEINAVMEGMIGALGSDHDALLRVEA